MKVHSESVVVKKVFLFALRARADGRRHPGDWPVSVNEKMLKSERFRLISVRDAVGS